MGVLNTTYTFTATDLVTSTKLNNLIDETIFTSDAITGTTLEVTGAGKLRVATGGVTSNELASNSVTTAKIASGAVTTAKIADANVTSGKLSAYGLLWSSAEARLGQGTSSSSYYLALAPDRTADGSAILYFGAQSGAGNNAAISRASGANGNLTIINTGTGTIDLTSAGLIRFSSGGVAVMSIAPFQVSITEDLYVTGLVTSDGGFITSDYRLKSNVTALDDQLAAVLALRPVSYTLAAAPRLGLIAHEVQEHFPEAVRGVKDAVDEDGQPIYQAIEYTALIPALISAIQSQQRQIDELKNAR